MQRLAPVLPVGPQPGWELEDNQIDGTALKTQSESLVVLQSLKQSRNKWVTTMFPKFSTKTRGSKAAEVTPPPHTIKAHGKYNLYIGPHVFSNTAVYEVHYLPSVDPSSSHEQPSIQTAPSLHPASPAPSQSQSATPLANVPPISYVTPALSSQVAIAAQSNPILANLLNAVINRTATDDQIKTLGLLIQSLEGVQQLDPPSVTPHTYPAAPVPTRVGSPKPFDIVLEFHERPSDRWVLPRGDVVCERVGVADGVFSRGSDVIVATSFATPSATTADTSPSAEHSLEDSVGEVMSFRFSRVPQQLWELLVTWAGGPQKIAESKVALADRIKDEAPHSYLQYRLPEGDLLSEIRNAIAPTYTMKSIKPPGADSNRAKRKSVTRRPTLVPDTPSAPTEKSAPAKRRQSLKKKASAPSPIACHACGQTDVPLMMGGRYCRPCIDTGKAVANVPQSGEGTQASSAPHGYVATSIPHQASLPAPVHVAQDLAYLAPHTQPTATSATIPP